eukprot:symbB.v1.2.032378.t1/scaffold3885.1/size48838/2
MAKVPHLERHHGGAGRALLLMACMACIGHLSISFVQPSVLGGGVRTDFSPISRRAEEVVAPDVEVPETDVATAGHTIQPLFQELNVTNSTDARKLMGAMVAIFNAGDRAVDLVLLSNFNKSTLVYAIAEVPKPFETAAQVQLRRRDRKMRVRVLQHFQPTPDPDAEVMRISRQTNSTKLGSAIMSKFVDIVGNNLKRSVKLEFQGAMTASIALDAIEKAQHKAHREFTFIARKIYSPLEEGAPNTVGVKMEVILVAT